MRFLFLNAYKIKDVFCFLVLFLVVGGLVAKLYLTLVTPWTVACHTPLSMGFSRQESWSGLLFPSPGDLSDAGIKPRSPALQADSLLTELWGKSKNQVWILNLITFYEVEVKMKFVQSCPNLCNPMDYTVNGILQARILEWVVVPFPRGSSQPRDQTQSPALQTDSLPTEPPGKSGSVFKHCFILLIWDKTFCRLKLFLIGKKLNLKFYQSNNRDFSMNKDSNFNWKKSPTFCAIGAIKKI